MRVIAGIAKGKILSSPKGLKTRPTAGRVKESIFSVLGPDLKDAVVLDLFAGSGSLGIEALSRGAQKTVFIEENFQAFKSITKNLETTGFEDKAKVLKAEVNRSLSMQKGPFDLIFIDAPYKMDFLKLKSLFLKINRFDLLEQDGLIIFEHSSDLEVKELGFSIKKQKKYGQTIITILELK